VYIRGTARDKPNTVQKLSTNRKGLIEIKIVFSNDIYREISIYFKYIDTDMYVLF